MHPKLIVEQKVTPFVNKYVVYGTDPGGNKGPLLALAQQKRLAFKEKVTFYSDEQKTQPVFTFRAEKVFDVHGRYIVEDMQGTVLGSFQKDFTKSLTSSTWKIIGSNDQPTLIVSESSKLLALVRRFGGFIPFIGDIIDLIVLFFRYHFVFKDTNTAQHVGRYQKTKLFLDHYTLSMTDEAFQHEDWRVLAAMAVALDALQSR